MGGMGNWFRKTLVFSILALGVGIPMGYWLKGTIARAENRKTLPGADSLRFPPPPDLKIPPLEPLSQAREGGTSLPASSLEVTFSGTAWTSLPKGSLTLVLRGPRGASYIHPVEGKPLRFKDLPPGPWTLQVVPSPPGKEAPPLWSGKITLGPGAGKTLEVPSPPLASLEGKVLVQGRIDQKGPNDPGAGLEVRIYTSGGIKKTRTDKEGRFSFRGLLPGRALLVLAGGPSSGMGGTCQEIFLQGGTRSKVTLELRR